MHELAIAGAVLDSVQRCAEGRRVTLVQMRVGHLRQVVPAALEFSWQLITQDSIAEGAVLAIETVAVVGRCRRCGAETAQPNFPLKCRTCSSFDIDVIAGEELEIDWVEVEEEERNHELQAEPDTETGLR